MVQYLIDLIDRMNDISDIEANVVYVSSSTISWKATREAEKLTNETYITELIKFIDTEKSKEKRDSAYFALGHLVKNTDNLIGTKYLIQRVDKEKNKYVLKTLLDRIIDLKKPLDIDLAPILSAIKSKELLVRHSAIEALNNTVGERGENILIELLQASKEPYDLIYIHATLSGIGTVKALPYLKKNITHKIRDVRGSAESALTAIMSRL